MRLRDLLPGRRAPVEAHLSIGSNVGDRDAHLEQAVAQIGQLDGVTVTAVSGVYETAPVGGVEQEAFLNLVVAVRTDHGPRDLLHALQAIEDDHGRDRRTEQRWGPRPLDIDIVLYGELELDDPDLVLPHPRLHERAFVLIPLLEVYPGGRLPDGTSVAKLVNALAPIEGVALAYRYDDAPGSGPGRPAGPGGPGPILAEDWTPPRGAPPGTER